ncbi:ABC transporter permease [Ktedonosporobacter rubrisoli]|uniref:ABC transporter permease n=1 Tax=Ktedonosporobacter rubrisoli TaxID=2509675 RepID=A0A4P6JTA1_KTERU|nr:ABC transporter permease [Ktedonosporobacter rubrisoli]QBD78797.1 ABC transporter permease [Ktedonosporobacter rubrisoli]
MRHMLRRILFYLLALWAAATLDFVIPRLAPGNPVQIMLGRLQRSGVAISPGLQKAMEAQFGLNTSDPMWLQYLKYLQNLLTGNWGISLTNSFTPVKDVIGQGLMWTLSLGLVAVLISFVLGCLFGVIVGWRRGGALDSIFSPGMAFLSAIPYFWLALILVYLFGFTLRWFPFADGFDTTLDIGWTTDFILSALYHAILPAITLIVASLSGWMLVMRNSMVTTLSEDYVLMAMAKGLKKGRVMFSYAARNAILPNVSGFAIALGSIVGGQLLTEIVFSYPGIGFSLFSAVKNLDYPLIQGIFFMIALGVLGANFLADLAYALLDPRVRQERSA